MLPPRPCVRFRGDATCRQPRRTRSKSQAGRLGAFAAWLLLTVCTVACTPSRHDVPLAQTLRAYRQALRNNQAAAAFGLLSNQQQSGQSIDQFAMQWDASRVERAAQLALLDAAQPLGQQVRETAGMSSIVYGTRIGFASASAPSGELVLSATASGRWRIASAGLLAPDTATPEAALRNLLAALDQRSFSAVFRLLSAPTRQAVEEELRERAERLRSALQAATAPTGSPSPRSPASSNPSPSPPTTGMRIEVQGNRARIYYDPRFFIDLVREPEGWRIRDMN